MRTSYVIVTAIGLALPVQAQELLKRPQNSFCGPTQFRPVFTLVPPLADEKVNFHLIQQPQIAELMNRWVADAVPVYRQEVVDCFLREIAGYFETEQLMGDKTLERLNNSEVVLQQKIVDRTAELQARIEILEKRVEELSKHLSSVD
jgi:hypothetical protein